MVHGLVHSNLLTEPAASNTLSGIQTPLTEQAVKARGHTHRAPHLILQLCIPWALCLVCCHP